MALPQHCPPRAWGILCQGFIYEHRVVTTRFYCEFVTFVLNYSYGCNAIKIEYSST